MSAHGSIPKRQKTGALQDLAERRERWDGLQSIYAVGHLPCHVETETSPIGGKNPSLRLSPRSFLTGERVTRALPFGKSFAWARFRPLGGRDACGEGPNPTVQGLMKKLQLDDWSLDVP